MLGTLAALALVRYGRFPGRTLFTGMVYAPLVMPEVITGLSLLLLFVAHRPRPRLLDDHARPHHVHACASSPSSCSRGSSTFDRVARGSGDGPRRPPLRTFFLVTLPIIAPAVAAGWLLAFTLSLDDLVIASFTTGPGATTLPMRIYSQVRLGVTPEINAASTILIARGQRRRHRGDAGLTKRRLGSRGGLLSRKRLAREHRARVAPEQEAARRPNAG